MCSGDTLLDAGSILDSTRLLTLLMEPLQALSVVVASGGEFDWRAAEAALYCLRCVLHTHRRIFCMYAWYIWSVTACANHDHVPITTQVCASGAPPPPQDPLLLALFASLPQLPPVPSLQYTAALMTGSYSGWLDASLQQGMQLSTVLQLLQMLVNGFGHHTTAPAATYALRNVCEACAGPLAPAMPMLGDLYQRVTTGGEGNLQEEEVQQVCERHVVVIVHVVVMYWLVC